MTPTSEKTRLYLGYDASCMQCSTVAARIESLVGNQLTLLPLTSPLMDSWRRKTLGDDAPWTPTLVRVNGSKGRAYVGWQMGPQLAAALGVKRSLAVLSALGGEQLEKKRPQADIPSRLFNAKDSFSRKIFLRSSAVLAGMAIVAGISRPAVASPEAQGRNVAVKRTNKLSEADTFEELKIHFDSADVSNVVSSASLGTAAKGAKTLGAIPSEAFTIATETTGTKAPDGDVSEVQASRTEYSDGTIESSIAVYNHQSSTMVVSRRMNKPLNGVSSIVRRLNVSQDRLTSVAHSVNGTIPHSVDAEDISTLDSDPCSGCAGAPGDTSRKRLQDVCNWELTVSCARDAGICLGCIPTVVGSAATVVLCIGVQCGWAALDSCCSSMDAACVGCGGQT